MYNLEIFFWTGTREENVIVPIYDNADRNQIIEEQQIQEAFTKWLDNNEDVGWEIVDRDVIIEEEGEQ